jgi:probable HAF family extracellular repeat protein
MIWRNAYKFTAARTLELAAFIGTTRKSGMSEMLALLWLCASASQSTAQTYTVTDLGTLPGNSVSQAYALNDSGEATGVSETASATTATMFSGGKATSISAPGSSFSYATAINGSGEIAGWNVFVSNFNSNSQAFLYSHGSVLNINSAALFPSGTEAHGINSFGEVVGTGYLSGSNFHAFLYRGSRMEDIGPSGAFQASADAINTAGQIVGTAIFPPVFYHPYRPGRHVAVIPTARGLVDLNTLIPAGTGFTLTDALAINDLGRILCDATTASSHEHAVLLSQK